MLCKPPHKGDIRACSSVGSPVLPVREVEVKFFDRQEAAALELEDQDAAHANFFCWSWGLRKHRQKRLCHVKVWRPPTMFLSWPTTECSRVNHPGS